MTEPRGIWVDPTRTDDVLVHLNQFELQLIVLALNWAVGKSRTKQGAQTQALMQLEERMRALHHQRVDLVNQLQKALDLLEDKQV